jgi:two-component system, response regulator RegA
VHPQAVKRILIVEDDAQLARSLAEALAEFGAERRVCSKVQEAVEWLHDWHPQLVVLDLKLPDGTALDVLERCEDLSPHPAVIGISGHAAPQDAFRLHELGVRAFLPKPLDPGELGATVTRVLSTAPDVLPQIRNVVGHVQLKEFEQTVRSAFIKEALGRLGASRRAAAKLLGVTRQALQHMLRREP